MVPSPLNHGSVSIRPIRVRDWRDLQQLNAINRAWLGPWEATTPIRGMPIDMKTGIRMLLSQMRQGLGVPFVMEDDGVIVGQLNVSQIAHGSLSSAVIGYWVSRASAGRSITPISVALATDYLFRDYGLHRVEICIRPENVASLRVVEKLGFRYEGLRKEYIHIAGRWRDHYSFALLSTEVPEGVLNRYVSGKAPAEAAAIPEADRLPPSASGSALGADG